MLYVGDRGGGYVNAYVVGRCACPPQGRATIATQGMCGVPVMGLLRGLLTETFPALAWHDHVCTRTDVPQIALYWGVFWSRFRAPCAHMYRGHAKQGP